MPAQAGIALAKKRPAESEPPCRRAKVEIDDKSMEADHQRQSHAIDLVNAPIDEEVARDSKQHHTVRENVKDAVIEDVLNAAEGSAQQRTRCDQQHAAMECRFAPPGDRESHAGAEDEHVAKGNAREDVIQVGKVEGVLVEAAHDTAMTKPRATMRTEP